jgi:hypothetical protein
MPRDNPAACPAPTRRRPFAWSVCGQKLRDKTPSPRYRGYRVYRIKISRGLGHACRARRRRMQLRLRLRLRLLIFHHILSKNVLTTHTCLNLDRAPRHHTVETCPPTPPGPPRSYHRRTSSIRSLPEPFAVDVQPSRASLDDRRWWKDVVRHGSTAHMDRRMSVVLEPIPEPANEAPQWECRESACVKRRTASMYDWSSRGGY